jgi:hypothetical protein
MHEVFRHFEQGVDMDHSLVGVWEEIVTRETEWRSPLVPGAGGD